MEPDITQNVSGLKKILIGVTGRAGSGKTTFARMLSNKGAQLLEADRIAQELYSHSTTYQKLVKTFGKVILGDEGKINRSALRKIVLAEQGALVKLNSIMHPPLLSELKYRINRSPKKVVIIDAALLLDWPLASECDLIIAVESAEEFFYTRMNAKGFSREDASRLLSCQRTSKDFRERCHLVVENNLGLTELYEKAHEVWEKHILPLFSE